MEESILGMQDAGAQVNAKHFIAYKQETHQDCIYAPDANAIAYIQDCRSLLDYITNFGHSGDSVRRTGLDDFNFTPASFSPQPAQNTTTHQVR